MFREDKETKTKGEEVGTPIAMETPEAPSSLRKKSFKDLFSKKIQKQLNRIFFHFLKSPIRHLFLAKTLFGNGKIKIFHPLNIAPEYVLLRLIASLMRHLEIKTSD